MPSIQLNHSDHDTAIQQVPLCLLAHDIDVALNVGSFFRIADALGVEKIFLTGRSPVPPHPRIRKTARSAEKHVDYEYRSDVQEVITALKAQHYRLISLEITSDSIPLDQLQIQPAQKVCLILGSENTGVAQPLLDVSEYCVHIPMMGHNSSMNVANACAIACYQISQQQRR